MSEKLKQILLSAGVAFLVAKVATSSDDNETKKKLAISAPRQLLTITSDFRTVEQQQRIDYWSVGNIAIPDNFLVSEIFAEVYDENFNQVGGNVCVWVVQNPIQQYAVGLLCDNPGVFNIRIVAKVIV